MKTIFIIVALMTNAAFAAPPVSTILCSFDGTEENRGEQITIQSSAMGNEVSIETAKPTYDNENEDVLDALTWDSSSDGVAATLFWKNSADKASLAIYGVPAFVEHDFLHYSGDSYRDMKFHAQVTANVNGASVIGQASECEYSYSPGNAN